MTNRYEKPTKLHLTFLSLFLVASLILAGCNSSPEPSPTPTPTPTSLTDLQIITRCEQAMVKTSSFHFEEAIDISSRQYGETDIRLHTVVVGDFVRPDKFKAIIERSGVEEEAESWSGGTMTVVRVGTIQHQNAHQWRHVPGVFWGERLYIDPDTLLTNILGDQSALARLEDEEVAGIASYHFEGSRVAPDDIPAQVEIWISKEDFLVCRVTLKGNIPESEGGGQFAVTLELSSFNCEVTIELPPTPEPITITGVVADGRYPYGSLTGIPNATVSYLGTCTTTDQQGRFSLTVPGEEPDSLLEITSLGYVPYVEHPSRMVEGAFHLIPEDLYHGVYLVLWNPEPSNPQNWHRKWEQQTEFVIVESGASKKQIDTVLSLLAKDEYRKMTGGRFTSTVQPTIVDSKPTGADREGKTVISFAPGIIPGGIAHSEDRNGVIYYAEITWDVNQVIGPKIFWHEMFHTVTAGGHINEWPSVVNEVATITGYVTKTDEQIMNCIYNSPPHRAQPDF